jgi:hypothetical protein
MKKLVIFLASSLVVGFAKPAHAQDTGNVCHIFKNNPTWYKKAKATEDKWGIPVPVQMAIMHTESNFNAHAKAPTSTAYGFSQALNGTWAHYQRATQSTGRRDDFGDATDFIGWYAKETNKVLGILPNNPFALYLAYHEGAGAYKKASYNKKPWLVRLAKKVNSDAGMYSSQLSACQSQVVTS